MENNKGFVICIKSGDKEYYLGQRDGVMVKIIGAVIYHDEMYADSELRRVRNTYRGTENPFFNNIDNLSIQPIEINFIKK